MDRDLSLGDSLRGSDVLDVEQNPGPAARVDPAGGRETPDSPSSSGAFDWFQREVADSLAEHILTAYPGMLWPPAPSTKIYDEVPAFLKNDVWLRLQELCLLKRQGLRRARQNRITADRIAGRLTS